MNTEQSILKHVTAKDFESEVIESELPVIVDFWAPWCGPCRAVGPILEDLAGQWAGRVKVVKLNVDEEPEVAGAFRIRSIPTILAIRGKEVIDVQVGYSGQKALESLFHKLAESKVNREEATHGNPN
ncbi:MAG: thioredoxin [Deltaproteobacteria bacterium]|nr:thioredoxin [Deltaproteobacteria bacterium]